MIRTAIRSGSYWNDWFLPPRFHRKMENVTARLSLSKMLVVRKGLFSIDSSVVIYEAQLTQKSLSNEGAFLMLSTANPHDHFEPAAKSARASLSPSCKIHGWKAFYWKSHNNGKCFFFITNPGGLPLAVWAGNWGAATTTIKKRMDGVVICLKKS